MTSQDKRWLNVPLTLEEKATLVQSAIHHKRTAKQQAAIYIADGLQRDGFMTGSQTDCQCPHCGGELSEEIIADALGAELMREVNS